MKTLTGQTIYQCEYCNKRLLTKKGAKIHEEDYCWESPIKKEKRRIEVLSCEHDWTTSWSPIFGEEHLKEPDYDYCFKCGIRDTEWEKIVKEVEGQHGK
jgi:hypothetical protein